MRLSLTGLVAILLLASCDPDEQEPGYLYIPEFDFAALPGEGTSSEKITEVWVYAEEKVLGVFDLPARIPILNQGATDILIFAGIWNNGISTTRIRYPFIQPFDTVLTPAALKTDTIVPRFRYFPDLFIEEKGFESGNFLVPAGTNQGSFDVVTDDALVFEGSRSGYGVLEAGEQILYFKDDDNLELVPGNTIFLELNYSCNNSFGVGLLETDGSTTEKHIALIINPTRSGTGNPVWNKIYVDLGLIPLQNQSADHFEVIFEAIPDESGDPVELYLDNLKLVQFD